MENPAATPRTFFSQALLEGARRSCRYAIWQALKTSGVYLYSNRRSLLDWCLAQHEPFIRASRFSGGEPLPPVYAIVGPVPRIDSILTERTPLFLGQQGAGGRVGGCAFFRDDQSDSLCMSTPTDVFIWLSGEGEASYRGVARIVREILIARSLRSGALRCHGAIGIIDERAILLLGPGGSGKTSLLLQTICRGDRIFCANDRLLLTLEQGRLTAHGIPCAIRIGQRCVTWLPELAKAAAELPASRTIKSRRACFRKYVFLPRELGELLKLEVVAATQVRAVVVPHLGEEHRPPLVLPVNSRLRLELLRRCMRDYDALYPPIVGSKLSMSFRNRGPVIAALGKIPWFMVRGRFDETTVIDRLLSALRDLAQA